MLAYVLVVFKKEVKLPFFTMVEYRYIEIKGRPAIKFVLFILYHVIRNKFKKKFFYFTQMSRTRKWVLPWIDKNVCVNIEKA